MAHFLSIYSDENVDIWIHRLFDARYNLGFNREESKQFLMKRHKLTEDEYEGICELADEKNMNIKLEE